LVLYTLSFEISPK